MRRVAVIGESRSGKTTTLQGLATRLCAARVSVAGLLQPALEQGGAHAGYELLDLASGERCALARRQAPGADGIRFAIDTRAFAWAAPRLLAARAQADVVVLDELGRLEANGEGHLPALLAPLPAARARLLVCGVRRSVAAEIERRIGALHLVVAPTDEDPTLDELVGHVVRLLQT